MYYWLLQNFIAASFAFSGMGRRPQELIFVQRSRPIGLGLF